MAKSLEAAKLGQRSSSTGPASGGHKMGSFPCVFSVGMKQIYTFLTYNVNVDYLIYYSYVNRVSES